MWLRTAPDYFLPEALVRERVPSACSRAPDRAPRPSATPNASLTRGRSCARCSRSVVSAQAFIAGDGAVNYALLDDLVAAGVPATRDHLESFFNMPKKSA